MKYNFIPVIPDDVDLLNHKSVYSVGEIGCVKDMIALSVRNPEQSLCRGFGPLARLHGIAGSYKQWDGSSQLWAIFDDQVDQYPIALYKSCIILINYAVQKQNLRRVSLTVRASYTKGNRFAQSLGFDLEGRMVGFLPDGDDANLFARLF